MGKRELNTSLLYTEIRKREAFLSKKLLEFAADFLAEDLASIVNKYLVKQEVQTSWQLIRGNGTIVSFNEFLNNKSHYESYLPQKFSSYSQLAPKPLKSILKQKSSASDPIQLIMDEFVALLKKSDLGIQTENVLVPLKNDIQIGTTVRSESVV